MTNRDFDQSDGIVLAEFAGFEHDSRHIYIMPEKLMHFHVEDNPYFPKEEWKPWSLEAPMWQIQSLKDAVREKEKKYVRDFQHELADELDGRVKYMSPIDWVEAPPEAICSAILSLLERK